MSPSDRTSPSRKLLAMMRNVPPDLKALLALVGIGGITAMATIGYKLNSDPEVRRKLQRMSDSEHRRQPKKP